MFILFGGELINTDHVCRIYQETIYFTEEDGGIMLDINGVKLVDYYKIKLVLFVQENDEETKGLSESFFGKEKDVTKRFEELQKLLCK
jgi:hypothetical protein